MWMLELYRMGLLQKVEECATQAEAEYRGWVWDQTPGHHHRIEHVA